MKKCVPKCRSDSSKVMATDNDGVAKSTIDEVTIIVHTNMGSWVSFIPGARMLMVVTRKLIAPSSEEAPSKCRPRIQKSIFRPGSNRIVVSGGYDVQPPLGN